MAEGYHVFKWNGGGENVIVTGTFDDWKETAKMVKGEDGSFSATVDIPHTDKVMYKFVVDGKWSTDDAQRLETDANNNTNNYLLPEDIKKKDADPVMSAPVLPADEPDSAPAPFMQSAGPMSTTAALAAAVPLESAKEEAKAEDNEPVFRIPEIPDTSPAGTDETSAAILSSAAPDSTTAALAAQVPFEDKKADTAAEDSSAAILSSAAPDSTTAALAAEVPKTDETPAATSAIPSHVLPTPGNGDVPGGFPDTPVREQTEDELVKINPIAASETAGNPVHLEPGEPLPPTTASVTDNVKLDEESYDKPDASNLGVGATAAAGLAAVTGAMSSAYHSVVGEGAKAGEEGAGGNEIYVPEVVKNLIPESALPITVPGVGVISAPEPTKEDGAAGDNNGEGSAQAASGAVEPGSAAIEEPVVPKDVDPTTPDVSDVVEVKKVDPSEGLASAPDAAAPPAEVLPVVPETTPAAPAPAEASPAVVETPADVTTEASVPQSDTALPPPAAVLPLIEADNDDDEPAKATEASKSADTAAPAAEAAAVAPVADKPAEPVAATTADTGSAAAAASSSAKPADETAKEDSASGKEKKKKNRISQLFQKFKKSSKK